MPYTYPPAAPTVANGEVTTAHHLLKTPTVLARRAAELSNQRYVADAALSGRFEAVGGAILYETGEPLYTEDAPEIVTPGSVYPVSRALSGDVMAAKTVKWGQDIPITDESIARLRVNAVERALQKLVNHNVKTVDAVAMAVINSRVTQTFDASANPWDTGISVVRSVLQAKALIASHNQGWDADMLILNDFQWAAAMAELVASGILPRDSTDNPIVSGNWPNVLGVQWLATPNTPANEPILLDSRALGGMADEAIAGPGYARAKDGGGVEVKSIRRDETDSYLLRARRVTVPIVLEPLAAVRMANTGLAGLHA